MAFMAETVADQMQAAEAYRRSLLDLLGTDDPATVQAGTLARLRDLVDRAGADLRARPEPGEWSVIECIGHLVDSELTTAARVRWIVSEDQPDIVAYDQALWVDRLRHVEDDSADLIEMFDVLTSTRRSEPWPRSVPDARRRLTPRSGSRVGERSRPTPAARSR
jgi:hypothetical protein